jgi:hypothetical protein
MRWRGFTVTHGGRKAEVSRSHGCWLAIVYFKNGNPRAGQYFQYGPGALQTAMRWCEQQLRRPKGAR